MKEAQFEAYALAYANTVHVAILVSIIKGWISPGVVPYSLVLSPDAGVF